MAALRLTTAGESHGPALVAIVDGVPAGLELEPSWIDAYLVRRQKGYGSGGRMRIESDRVEILAGLRGTTTLGSPLALRVPNKDHTIDRLPAVHRPRPGHADLPGMLKYGTDDARNILERASARETAARVAGGAVAARLLDALGIRVAGYLVELGDVAAAPVVGELDDVVRRRELSAFQCPDPEATEAMTAAVDAARESGDTLGGIIEVRAHGLPPGLGGFAQPEDRLDGRLAGALCRIQAMKGVEVGQGFASARLPGSEVHDEIVPDGEGGTRRPTNRSGGIEGGMTNGEDVVVRVAMKPLASLRRSLRSVDVRTGEEVDAARQRSDVCAAPRASVVAECVVAFELARVVLEKTGGDSLAEVHTRLEAHRRACDELFRA